ncbi:putative NAD(P)H quinone oxidoreductase, PIG3 family [Sanguibacter gelidistatuariae]|uniref:Putative NAD(P)H quinone oxidoreductase, PIG3 family n=1 Tax=Sanguibacter gelidistatuariae TaxID=1814289 RepID=A0A1G6GXS3_9MICO|nr:NAD(P)H-quinone oxidoreductase [Sanguibacter gelidistatuariae]SDB86812.1 putative NAD(P)H quinone oxidoreductase, PIG3 family [Sanguibacter gelidistatuariae]
MRAVMIEQFGGPEVLKYTEVTDVLPGQGEVLVEVRAAGVNRADVLQRQGHYPPPPGAPAWPGLEVSGVITGLGAGVSGWQVGERVAALVDGGGYASHAAVPAAQLLRVPDGVGLVEAAGLPEAVCTVWSNLVDTARLQAGEWVLVHGGSGGVGTVAIQLAAALGARVMVTAGSQDRVDRCLALGAEVGFVHRTSDGSDFASALPGLVQEATGRHGADVILDVVGAAYLDANVRSLATGGRLVVIGMQGGRRGELDLGRLLALRASVSGTTLRARPAQEKAQIVTAVRAHVWPMLEDGRLRPVIDSVVAMSRAGEAHALLDSGAVFGKVLLVP